MKVYVLINSYQDTVEGVYTTEGKKARNSKLLEEAHINRLKQIDVLEVAKARCIYNANYYKTLAAKMSHDMSASEVLNLIAVSDWQIAERKSLEERINTIYQKTAEEVLKEYLPMYHWEERELEGD